MGSTGLATLVSILFQKRLLLDCAGADSYVARGHHDDWRESAFSAVGDAIMP